MGARVETEFSGEGFGEFPWRTNTPWEGEPGPLLGCGAVPVEEAGNRGTSADPSCRSFYYYYVFSFFLMATWELGTLSSSSLGLIKVIPREQLLRIFD